MKEETESKGLKGLPSALQPLVMAAKTQMIFDLCTMNGFPTLEEANAMAEECIMQVCEARKIPEEERHGK